MPGSAAAIIAALGLERHPEGGWYAETLRDGLTGDRSHSTAIYFLLEEGDVSRWHRVKDATEVWHYYAGAALELILSRQPGDRERHLLGADIAAGEMPQAVVAAGCWQTARSLGAWTLCGCTVAPGFEFGQFELAEPGWEP